MFAGRTEGTDGDQHVEKSGKRSHANSSPCIYIAFRPNLVQRKMGVLDNHGIGQRCQDFFFGGPNFDFQKPWRAAANIASSSPLRSPLSGNKISLSSRTHDRGEGGANRKFFPLEVDPPPSSMKPLFPDDIFQCGPRATTCGPRATKQVRPAIYNANFWTLCGPRFMASRATFGPRAALFSSLI